MMLLIPSVVLTAVRHTGLCALCRVACGLWVWRGVAHHVAHRHRRHPTPVKAGTRRASRPRLRVRLTVYSDEAHTIY